MQKPHNTSISLLILVATLLTPAMFVSAQDIQPKYVGGYPTVDTTEAAFEEYDYQAATQFYIWGYAYLNSMGYDKGLAAMGGDEWSIYIFNKRYQPQHILLTPNSEVIYVCTRAIDLTHGPVVVEVPPRSRGHFFDIGMRAYLDTGDVGPDKGKGGKYVMVARDYKGDIPKGYYEVRSKYSDFLIYLSRTFPESEGSVEAAAKHAENVRLYPLSAANKPPKQDFVLIGDRPFSQEWPRDSRAFDWLGEVFAKDRPPAEARPHLGNMRRLGLAPGEKFTPDDRAKLILERAAKTSEAIVLSMAFRNRVSKRIYDDRQWEPYANNRSSVFLQENYEEVEERAGGWHQLVGNFANYTPAQPGTGQFSMATYRDSEGNPLQGDNLYSFTMPAKVPLKQFWQVPIYSTTNRSLVQTDGVRATISSTDEGLLKNDDGSVTVYIGPTAPKGFERNWIKTNPGEGWFTLLRLYAPLEPILNKSWRPNDIELVK